ncbi:MAG: domain S-box protein [Flavipsychrobacter sp.]|jgi:PAS domain S-box-containing protein|nr:domain S-box protein [Flavipsychrobacter sp.]
MKNANTQALLDSVTDTELKRKLEFERINLTTLINNISGVMWSIDRDYNLITSNSAFDVMFEKMSGAKPKQGQSVFIKGFSDEHLNMFRQFYDRAFKGETFTIEEYNETYDRWYDISFYPIRQSFTIVGAACYSHDITQRKATASKLSEAKRLYAFTSQVNKAIIHAKSEEELLEKVCLTAGMVGEYDLVVAGRIDEANRKFKMVSQFNATPYDQEIFANMNYEPGGPTENVLLKYDHHLICDVNSEPGDWSWKKYALHRGFRSLACLPLKKEGNIVYIVNLLSKRQAFCNKADITVLDETVENISFALDVFEKEKRQVHAEKEREQSNARLKHAQKVAQLGYWELNLETRVATWSEEHCRIFGVDPANNMHSYESWLSFVHPDDVEYVLKMSKEGEASMKSFSFHHRIIRGDGLIRHIHSQNEFEFNSEGVLTGFFGTSQDVTEIKQTEEKLKHSAFRFNQAQEITHLGNWELDFTTGGAVWSAEACRIYGLPLEENIQSYENWISFIHPDDLGHVMLENSKAAATHSNSNIYHRIIRRDGTVRHIHSQAHFEFDNEGKPVGLYGTAHDITDQTANIAQLKVQNEKLREIAWIQSHKVRGPLATILGLAQLFKDDRPCDDMKEIVQGILQSSEKLDAVIREIVGKTTVAEVHGNTEA